MVSQSFYTQLVVRVFFIALSALAAAFFFMDANYILAVMLFLAFVGQILYLLYFFNQTNRAIAYFFHSIQNEDFTLRFPMDSKLKSLSELNQSLNVLNEMVQEMYLKNEAKEKYYQEILKQADIGILAVNPKGHIYFANPTMEKLLSHSPLNHIKQLQQVDEDLYELFNSLGAFERKLIELTNEREQKQLALKSSAITLNGENLMLVVAQDIDKELDEKETDSWVRLIRVLTHEIMNTITPITSISDTIIKYFKVNETVVDVEELEQNQVSNTLRGLEVIKEQGGNLMDFVQSYRSLLSVPEPDRALIKGGELVEKISVIMATRPETEHIDFSVKCIPSDLELFIDEKQISQVLVNLCKNAMQSVGQKENGRVSLIAREEDGSKFIQVWDNGPGIPPDLMEEIFIPFFTTKTEGTGIGLSLSKRVMQLHGGSLKVHSVPNEETVFRLVFS